MGVPLISIIIATYNSGNTIRRAMQSVKDQSFLEWECLVIDGASNDNTMNIVKEFSSCDSRFRYISEPDNGIYDAFNKGWKNAKGNWIHYLGSDDFFSKDGLSCLAESANNCKESIAIISADVYNNLLDGSLVVNKALNGNPGLGNHQGMLMRRSIIEQYNGFDTKYKILADFDLMVRILNDGHELQVVQCPPVAYFTQGGTTSLYSSQYNWFKDRYMINKKFKNIRYPLFNALNILRHKIRSITYRKFRKTFHI